MGLAISNVSRYKKKSCITILLVLLLLMLVNIYLQNIESNIHQLNHLKDAVPVFCRITNANGTKESGLTISYEMLKNLEESQNIEKLVYTVRMMGGIGNFREEEWSRYLNLNIMSSNSLDELMGSGTDAMNLSKKEQEEFVTSSEANCLASKAIMENREWQIGDIIDLKLYYYLYDDREGINLLPLDCVPVEIIGEIPETAGSTQVMSLDIILPIQFVREEYKKADIAFSADSASFYVKNPLKLNEFKEEMQSYHFLQQSAEAFTSYQGNALSVMDGTFIKLATNLQQTISLLKTCLIPICISIVGIGYLVSLLLMRGRQKEFLLMRAMGMRVRACTGIFLLEQAALSLAGEAIGFVCCTYSSEWRSIVYTAVAVVFCYLLGTCAALWKFSRKSIMQLLNMKE